MPDVYKCGELVGEDERACYENEDMRVENMRYRHIYKMMMREEDGRQTQIKLMMIEGGR